MQGDRDDLANDDTPNKKCYFPLQVDDRRRGSKIQTLDDVICECSLVYYLHMLS